MSAKIQLIDQYSDQWWRLNNLYWIIDKDGRRVKFIPNTSQECLYWDMWYRNVILKARQRGFTTFIDIFALDTCVFNGNFSAGIIAHNMEDSKKIFRTKVKYPYDNLPEGVKAMVSANNDRAGEYVFSNGSSISVSVSYRSGTLQLLHVSEFGKIAAKSPDKALEIKTGAFEAVPKNGVIFVESTAEGNGGDFYDMVQSARNLEAEGVEPVSLQFKYFFEPWWSNPEYAIDSAILIDTEFQKYFERLKSDHGIELTAAQKAWYVVKAQELGEEMKREYPSHPDEAFEVAVQGAYYAQQMAKARKEGRITRIPIEPNIPVNTFWDLGKNDTTVIWFHQQVGKEHRFIDYYEESGEDLDHYIRILKEKDYLWGRHYLPHDVETELLGMKRNRKRQLEDGGVRPITVVPRVSDINEGIQLVRQIMPLCWFDKERTAPGIKALDNYQKEWNESTGTFRNYPMHNWASNGADGFRQFAQGYQDKPNKRTPSPQPKVSVI